MALDPVVEKILASMAAQGAKPIEELGPAGAREVYREMISASSEAELDEVLDLTCPGPLGDIPLRLYRPKGKKTKPVTLYFHGGGWVIGDLETHDSLCRELAFKTESIVVAVDYRLAPEHPYPAACNDCYAAVLWARSAISEYGGNPAKMAVAGDSAGGNLATVVTLMLRNQKKDEPRLRFQLLLYPVTTCTADTDSYKENAEGYLLTKAGMDWFWDQYAASNHRNESYASPLQAPNLSDLPPALIVTAEYDPLRDEGEMYGQKLQEAGVATEIMRCDGMIHGFVHMYADIPKGGEVLDYCAKRLRKALS